MHGLTTAGSLLNAPGPWALAALGAAGLLLIAGALISLGIILRRWTRVLAVLVGLIGLAAVELCLYAARKQTVTTRLSEAFRVTRPRYSEELRIWALVGQVGIPVAFVVAAPLIVSARDRRLHEEVPDLLHEGLRHLYHREYNAAVIEFSAAIKIEPHRADLYCKRSLAFEQLQEYDLALFDLERALERDPNLVEAYLRRGSVRTGTGSLDEALADFERVLTARPNDVECHLLRGVCLARKGQNQEATASFEKVLRLTNHPDFADPARRHLRELGT
jgi:tetratricopeptide (TPR) repeat protein